MKMGIVGNGTESRKLLHRNGKEMKKHTCRPLHSK